MNLILWYRVASNCGFFVLNFFIHKSTIRSYFIALYANEYEIDINALVQERNSKIGKIIKDERKL